mgnify:CR=1 FL=1
MSIPRGYPDIRDAVVRLCADFPGEYWRALDREREYPTEFVRALTTAGYLSVLIPEEYGGAGMSNLDGILVAEELAWGCSGIGTAMEANALAQQPVILGASDYLKRKYLQLNRCTPAHH